VSGEVRKSNHRKILFSELRYFRNILIISSRAKRHVLARPTKLNERPREGILLQFDGAEGSQPSTNRATQSHDRQITWDQMGMKFELNGPLTRDKIEGNE
jgi:hypothetical protein